MAHTQIGEYLRELRQAKGWTTRELAAMAASDHSMITRMETGERYPNLEFVWRLLQPLEGELATALYYMCLDAGVPEEAAERAVGRIP